MNAIAAIATVNALLLMASNLMAAAQQANALIQKAHSEGRDISEEELASLRQSSEAMTTQAIQALDEAAGAKRG